MGFLKERKSPIELAAYLPTLMLTMGLDKILAAMAEQLDVKEEQLPENPAEATWAFQIYMVVKAVNRGSYSAESRQIVINSFRDGSIETFKQLGLNPKVISAMLREFRSLTSDGNSEKDYHNLAATLLRLSLGSKAANNEKTVGIIARWIVRMNSGLDKELARYKLTW